jgi:hypothetical protein
MTTQLCVWCEEPFAPRLTGDNHYSLELAGTKICWSCSDSFQEKMLQLHQEPVKGMVDTTGTKIVTESGYVLPLRVSRWIEHKYRSNRALAVDLFGNNWNAGLTNNTVTLRPAG